MNNCFPLVRTIAILFSMVSFATVSNQCAAVQDFKEETEQAQVQPSGPLDFNAAEQKAFQEYQNQAVTWWKPSTQPYLPWLNKHVNSIMTLGPPQGNRDEIKLVITSFGNDDRPISEPLELYRSYSSSWGLSKDGYTVHGFCYSGGYKGGGQRGGSGTPLTKQEMERLDQLVSELPSDNGVLPPPNRRVLVESIGETEVQSRVYDLANLPPQACKLFQLASYTKAHVPFFEPHTSIQIPEVDKTGVFSLSPQNEIIYSGKNEKTQWLDGKTFEFVAESEFESSIYTPTIIIFSPDGEHAFVKLGAGLVLFDLKTHKKKKKFREAYFPSFTSDGKHVLLNTGMGHPPLVLSTDTWEPVDRPADLPDDWDSFFAAKMKPRTVAFKRDRSAVLWNTQKKEAVKTLKPWRKILSFSPDESRVALQEQSGSVMILDTDTGEKLSTLTLFETNRDPLMHAKFLWWTPDGKYLLTVFQDSSGVGTICIFNAQTGRHRGVLGKKTGPGGITRVLGIGYQKDSQQFFIGDSQGKVWFWKLPDVLQMVQEFEASLAR